MKIQIRTTDLTQEQQVKEDLNYEAVKLLKRMYIPCEYVKTFTLRHDKYPGYILIG